MTAVKVITRKLTNCALCDKSTKFGTDVHWYGTVF